MMNVQLVNGEVMVNGVYVALIEDDYEVSLTSEIKDMCVIVYNHNLNASEYSEEGETYGVDNVQDVKRIIEGSSLHYGLIFHSEGVSLEEIV
jgi:hypothetical protein